MSPEIDPVVKILGQNFTPVQLRITADILRKQREVPSQLLWQSPDTKQIWLSPLAALVLVIHNRQTRATTESLKQTWLDWLASSNNVTSTKNRMLATLFDQGQRDAADALHNLSYSLNITTRMVVMRTVLARAIKQARAQRRAGVDYLD